jgi:hypothetical protein
MLASRDIQSTTASNASTSRAAVLPQLVQLLVDAIAAAPAAVVPAPKALLWAAGAAARMAAWTAAYLPGPAAAPAAGRAALVLVDVPSAAGVDSQHVCCRHMQMASAEKESSNCSG